MAPTGCEALQAPRPCPSSRCTQLFSLPLACQGRPHLRALARCLGSSCHITSSQAGGSSQMLLTESGERTLLSRDLAFLTWQSGGGGCWCQSSGSLCRFLTVPSGQRRSRGPGRDSASVTCLFRKVNFLRYRPPAFTNMTSAGIGDIVPSLREAGQWSISPATSALSTVSLSQSPFLGILLQ